jgi:2-polyprenyl-3-methyl-5-hydroxy-6-metoxy-1,4-benzoquinol methylase
MNLFSKYIEFLGKRTENEIEMAVTNFLPRNPRFKFLDCGCDNGIKTIKRAKTIGTSQIWGIESIKERAKLARKSNLKVCMTNLNNTFPFKNNSFNCITATEVIEHLSNVDNFLSECKRVIKKRGILIISTENLAGWQNVFSLILGNQPYTGPYLSKKFSVVTRPSGKFYRHQLPMDPHLNVMTLKALVRLLKMYGFSKIEFVGVGFLPLPYPLSWVMSHVDRNHASYFVVKAMK